MSPRPKAVGIIRVSQVAGRESSAEARERFASPEVQLAAMRALCERDGFELIDTFPEMDISGGAKLERRTGMLRAIEAVESGRATVVIASNFDRLVRSLEVQAQILRRIEAAGGRVAAGDFGEVSQGTAAKWLSSTMIGMVSEYVRRSSAERTSAAQRRAIEEGRPPFAIPPGLKRVGARVEIDEKLAPIVRKAVQMRADGETIASVRAYLADHGIKRSYHGTSTLLQSRLLIGEIVFGKDRRPEDVWRGTVPQVVDRDIWERAQTISVPRGRRAKSDRLLARLGVLRCATCGARMVVGTANHGAYPLYRCPPNGGCPRRVTVSAELVERLVVDEVKRLIAGFKGTATAENGALAAQQELDAAQRALDGAISAFSGLETEPAAVNRLRELRDARDAARDRYDQLAADQAAVTVVITSADWDDLHIDDRRDLVQAVIERVTVTRGRGADRVHISPRTL
jgi:DNA invertase Pin-like site-specific DNA recombinase